MSSQLRVLVRRDVTMGPYDIHIFIVAGINSGHPNLPPISIYGGAMKARSAGRVTLLDAAADRPPVVDPRYVTDEEGYDRAVLKEAHELMLELASVPSLSRYLGPKAPTGSSDPTDSVVNYCHPAGTCKLGPESDATAVVDPTGKVHGLEGVYVADASLIPTIPRANINLPTAAMAARVVCFLLGLDPRQLVGGPEGHRSMQSGIAFKGRATERHDP